MALPEIDLPVELTRLKEKGWVKSERESDTGIGKTIEDKRGITENNIGEPDCLYEGNEVEIKAHRMYSSAMITLFTLEAGLRRLHDVSLMRKYGYRNGQGRQALKITLTTNGFTPQGLKLETDDEEGTISIVDKEGFVPWVWTTSDIHLKLHNL